LEIDILESDSVQTTKVWNTLHKNTSGDGGVPDEQNWPHIADCNTSIVGYWHNYGVLWTPDLLTFFVDEMPVREVKPYPSSHQPVMLILTAGKGGVGGGAPHKHPPTIKVDWVRVWH
jgi:beta-glucanase (GH16 family)